MTRNYTKYDQLPLTLSAQDVANALGISRANAYYLFHAEGFPTMRIGKRVMVNKEKFIVWVEKQSGGIA